MTELGAVDDAAFVGRRSELDRLERWIGECRQGLPRMVTLVGGAGVGKTALADELVRRSRAGTVVYSASFHDDVGVPFLPVVTAVGRDDLLRSRPGDGHDDGPSVVGGNPQLFMEVTETLLGAAARRPVLLRLDDLHWADRGSLDLLAHVLTAAARQSAIRPLHLFVLISIRPESGEASAVLGRLGQEPSHRTLELGPLDQLEVHRLLAELIGEPPSGRIQSDVMEVTEGNPLFVKALTAQLLRRGAIRIREGVAECTEEITAAGIELQHVLRSEIDRLDGTARHVATVASLMNTPVDLDGLRTATGWDEATLDDALEAAEAGGVLLERPDGEITFRHPAMRQLVAGDRTARATRSLHREIALRLVDDQRPDDPTQPERSIQIAHHLRRAGSRADPALIARYGTVAARASLRLGAWTKASRYAELVLDHLPAVDLPDPVAAELELRTIAALGHLRNHDPQATEEQCAAAIRLARRTGDLDAWGRALVLEQRSLLSLRPDAPGDVLDGRQLREFLETAGTNAPYARAQCWQLLAEMAVVSGGDRHAASEAVRLADAIGDHRLLAWAYFAAGLTDYVALRPASAITTLRAGEEAARLSGEGWILSALLVRRSLAHLFAGDLEGASAAAREAESQSLTTQNWSEYGMMLAGSAQISLARADLAGAERLALDALMVHERSSSPYTAMFAWPTLAYVRALRRDSVGALQAVDEWRTSGVRGSGRFRLLIDMIVGSEVDGAAALDLDRYAASSLRAPTAFDCGAVLVDVEVGLHAGDVDLLQTVRRRLVDLDEQGVVLLLPTAVSTRRLIAMIDQRLGTDERDHFAELERTLTSSGVRTEALLAGVERCLASDHGDAVQLAAEARLLAGQLRTYQLFAPLDRLRRGLPASIGAEIRLQRTVVVWDLVSSTPLLVDAGDDGFVDLVHVLNNVIRRRLDEHGGVAFKFSGDGVYAWFLEPAGALQCAAAVRNDLHDRNLRSEVTPLIVRTGIATGQPVDDAGDLFGLSVVIASRLCDIAAAEQILATDDTVDASGIALYVEQIGPIELKGVPVPVRVTDVSPFSDT